MDAHSQHPGLFVFRVLSNFVCSVPFLLTILDSSMKPNHFSLPQIKVLLKSTCKSRLGEPSPTKTSREHCREMHFPNVRGRKQFLWIQIWTWILSVVNVVTASIVARFVSSQHLQLFIVIIYNFHRNSFRIKILVDILECCLAPFFISTFEASVFV